MPEITNQRWLAAQEWIKKNSRQLDLEYTLAGDLISLKDWENNSLGFTLDKYPEKTATLSLIDFVIAEEDWEPIATWNIRDSPHKEPPKSLQDLLNTGQDIEFRKFRSGLGQELNALDYPKFSQAYEGIYNRLFPTVGHHEIHRDISAWEEMLSRDTALLRRLRQE